MSCQKLKSRSADDILQNHKNVKYHKVHSKCQRLNLIALFCRCLVFQQTISESYHYHVKEVLRALPAGRIVQRGDTQADEVSGMQDDTHPAQQKTAKHLLPILCLQKVIIIHCADE